MSAAESGSSRSAPFTDSYTSFVAAIDALLSRVYGVHTCELGGDFDYLGAFNAGESVSATAAAALNHDGRVFLTIN